MMHQQLADGAFFDNRPAQVAVKQIFKPDQVLDMNGFIQVIFFSEPALMLDCHSRSQQIIDRIARHDVNERKDNDRDQKKNGQKQQGSAKDISPHALSQLTISDHRHSWGYEQGPWKGPHGVGGNLENNWCHNNTVTGI